MNFPAETPTTKSTIVQVIGTMSTSVPTTTKTVVLWLAALILIVSTCSQAQGINCRKFVFAPICRGVAAKRGGPHVIAGPRTQYIHNTDRKVDDDATDGADNVYYPTSNPEMSRDRDMVTLLQGRATNHALKNKALWNYLAADNSKVPADYVQLQYRPADLVVNYDYE